MINDKVKYFCFTESGLVQDVAVKKSAVTINLEHKHHCRAAKHEGISFEGTRLRVPRLLLRK
jgi:hypothetical protein